MAEPARHETVALDQPRVRGEHQVGEPGPRIEDLDMRAGAFDGRAQPLPLVAGTVEVDRDLSVHPRVDLVEHPEVLGRAHEVAPAPVEPHVQRAAASSRRNSPTSVTMPRAWWLPRSASLVTTAWLMSTQYVSTPAGSRLPVAMAWSVEASMRATVTPGTSARMASAAATTSVITSGSGPSSRNEPPSTNGTRRLTHSYITPPRTKPSSTAAAIEPRRLTSLITRRWLACPPSVGTPSRIETPSDVPSTLLSMSWVAKPLPEKSTSTHPSRTRRARSGAAPVCTTAGPVTASNRPPPALARRIRAATSATSRPFGFSDDTSDAMNSNGLAPRGRSGACTRTPSPP